MEFARKAYNPEKEQEIAVAMPSCSVNQTEFRVSSWSVSLLSGHPEELNY